MRAEPRHLRVARTARYYVLGEAAAQGAELWIVCHGYGQLAGSFVRHFAPIAGRDRVIVAPEALNRYYHESAPGVHGADARVGATWMTREDRDADIRDCIDYLDTLCAELRAANARRVIALGFSQGAATVSRWAAHGRTKLDDVILWGSPGAHDLALSSDSFRGAQLTLVAGDSDRYMGEERVAAELQRLEAAGIACRVIRYDGGHRIEAAALHELIGI